MLLLANPVVARRLGKVSLGLGLVGLASVIVGLLAIGGGIPQRLCQVIFPVALFSSPIALAAVVSGIVGREETTGRSGLLAGVVTLGLFFLFWQ